MDTKTAIILTFSKDDNRGANLQCYALKKKLEELGVIVRFLDIQLPRKQLNITGLLVSKLKNICASSFRKRNKFAYTRKYSNLQQLKNNPLQADIFIVGSDQVWNPDLTRKLDPRVYFFSFLDDSVKRISYAASFGTSEWTPSEYDSQIAVLLSKFDRVSVREDSGCEICDRVFGRSDVVQCVDPSLLLTTNDIQKLIRGKIRPRKHIYSYLLYRSDKVFDLIDKISSQTKLKITGDCRNPNIFDKLLAIHGIERWLKNIAEAELVVTNSFHTMAVSILMHKDFIVVPPVKGREARLISLLNVLGLEDRYIGYGKNIDISSLPPIDYEVVDKNINNLRQSSIDFLNISL